LSDNWLAEPTFAGARDHLCLLERSVRAHRVRARPVRRVGRVITILQYAGDGLWSYEEDAYNPMNFLVMVQQYIQRCHKLGTISDDARTFAKNMNWELG
jgi:hypothetical protein